MQIFFDNFSWMIPNLALASLGVLFGFLYLYFRNPLIKIAFFILWILFLPNTIYLITDIEYLPQEWMVVDFYGRLLLLLQFSVLGTIGILSYFGALMPLEKLFKNSKVKKETQKLILIILNFAVAFAVVMGKVERTHSWYVFTQPGRVFSDVVKVITSPFLLGSIIFFAIFFSLIYFPLRKKILKLE